MAWQQDRIDRIAALSPEDTSAGLLWLAMNFPAVCDAMLDKVEYDAIDDPDPGREPNPDSDCRFEQSLPSAKCCQSQVSYQQ
jgi:hypothetical protein